jgi:hypothetical protein
MSTFQRKAQAPPARPAPPSDSDDETPTTTSDDDDDDDDDESDEQPAFARKAAAARPAVGSGSDEDEDESEHEDDEEHDTLSDEEEEETDEELSEGEQHAGQASAANARAVARPQTPGEVSAELVELALEVVDGDDVSPVVRLAFERAAPQVRASLVCAFRAALTPAAGRPPRRPSLTRWRPSSAARLARLRKSWRSTMKSS